MSRGMALGARLHRLRALVDEAHRRGPASTPRPRAAAAPRGRACRRSRRRSPTARCGPARRRAAGCSRSRRDPCTASACTRRCERCERAPLASSCRRSRRSPPRARCRRARRSASRTCAGARRSRRGGERRLDVAAHDAAAAQHVVGMARLDRRAGAPRRRARRPSRPAPAAASSGSGCSRSGNRGDGLGVADEREHRFAAEAGDAGGEHRLVAQVGKDREARCSARRRRSRRRRVPASAARSGAEVADA